MPSGTFALQPPGVTGALAEHGGHGYPLGLSDEGAAASTGSTATNTAPWTT